MLLLFLEVELMETNAKTHQSHRAIQVASILRSGINGNTVVGLSRVRVSSLVASILRSGINGNLNWNINCLLSY